MSVKQQKNLSESAQVDQQSIQPFPRSQKIYVQGSRPDIRVPMREISLDVTPTAFGGDPSARAGVVVVGRNGRTISEKMAAQGPTTLWGLATSGFPNLFFQGPFQSGAAAAVKKILANYDNYDVLMNQSMDPNGMHVLIDFREDGVTPFATVWKHGLEEMKV